MKTTQIKIKSVDDALEDFVSAFKRAQQSTVKQSAKTKVYFSNLEAVRRVLTVERIKLLKFIKTHKPRSVYELAKLMKKDLKNVSQDLVYLSKLGLVELKPLNTSRKTKQPHLLTDRITFEIVL